MENIRERNGAYQVIVRIDGKQISKTFSIKKYGSKRVALEYAKEYRSKLLYGNYEPAVKTKDTVEDMMDECLELFSRTVETQKKWRSAYNKFIKQDYGDKKIASISSIDVQKCINKMVVDCSDDTIGRVLTLWKKLFKTAIIKDVVIVDPTIKVEKPKSDVVDKPKPQTLNEKDFWELLDTLELGSKDYKKIGCALKIIYYTGARPNEIYALNAEDVDRKNGLLSINKAIGTSTTERRVVKHTKNKTSIRTIPYNAKLEAVWDDLPNEGPLFIRENGEYLDGNYVSYVVKALSKGKVRSYTLRHQFSTDLINSGVDIRTIQELMGHTSSSMTLEYARSDLDKMKEAVSKK